MTLRRRLHAAALVFAPALAVVGCVTMPPSADRLVALERAYAAYQRIRMATSIAAPFLSPELQATIATAEARADVAFALARVANSAAIQLEQLREAETAVVEIETAAR